MDFIIIPFSWLLNVFYNFTQNYGLAIILFALVVKIVLFPVSLKGKKGMIQMSMLSGKLDQLKKQYGKDQARYNQEVQKLYEREKVNPMGGCLWTMLPLFVLIPLYAIIREPLKFLMDLSPEQITAVAEMLGGEFQKNGYEQLQMAAMIKDGMAIEGAQLFAINFKFLGIDLAAMPTWKIWTGITNWSAVIGPFVLVLVSTGLSVLMGKVSNKTNNMSKTQQSNSTNKTMMWMMPLMSLWIGFVMPAAMCIYWIANSVFSMLQEILAAKLLKKDYEKARIAAEERELREKEEEKQRKEQARLERERRAAEEKANRKKGIKKETESEQEGVNKEDSREGLRAHARGRAYIPDRFGGVTEYVDPNTLAPVDKKARKQQEKQAVQQSKPSVTEKVDLSALNKKSEETTPAPKADEE
ncbi:MAG: membrane protein insertase YidC [Ruminococcaceae bacterium]|nr:membrane protein insertase YidC [Oscillospiraceae bacterium]